jgi:hypothetical protein
LSAEIARPLKSYSVSRLTPKAFEFTKLFWRQESATVLFLLVDTYLGFAHNSFEEWQAATCRFSKEFCNNPGNVSTNSKKGIKNSKENSACIPCL